ncbi:TfoX/Sxy family protein [Devosia rhodophyticola]|uniref:TfoX/Sxy family protein n=1 Tax=Devosia rhodophyticola TaxID=3026423 RepID=A0ABY7YXC5_9HYPH|nr:TfoX/Sxy family protein [Devosia rhodophyticola]WDR05445.1 TfoX/Sxy family protein [Devosia rhodophyticola]
MTMTQEIAARLREHIAMDPRITERKMFGGIGFMLNGNMALGATSKGALMVRLGKNNDAAARALPGADHVDFAAKRMGGFLVVPNDAVEADDHLRGWIDLAMAFTASLPPK